jgi:hypothetical protein
MSSHSQFASEAALPLLGLVGLWLALLGAVLAAPLWLHATNPGDDLTRQTVRLALAFYGVAAGWMTRLGYADWRAASVRGQLARLCWSLGWVTYLVHVGMAFHYYHEWSHAQAIEHTEQVSGFGPGIYASHGFTLVWTLDVVFWWLWPERYAARPGWIDALLHGFMVFIVFNATVVYGSGFIRWVGAALVGALGVLFLTRFPRRIAGERG